MKSSSNSFQITLCPSIKKIKLARQFLNIVCMRGPINQAPRNNPKIHREFSQRRIKPMVSSFFERLYAELY
jgi:hypothetical protein